ncbi:MAG: hypothetical protein KJO43_07680, partial [Phycisphaerae bacterium]|nr:hypothetical protein [Phycisphaerae bacterium]
MATTAKMAYRIMFTRKPTGAETVSKPLNGGKLSFVPPSGSMKGTREWYADCGVLRSGRDLSRRRFERRPERAIG